MTGCCATGEQHDETNTYSITEEYYGKVLSTNKDLKTTACTAAGRPTGVVAELIAKVGWMRRNADTTTCMVTQIPDEVVAKFYGCGAPLPLGIDGLTVLDLGSGSGRDAYVCSALVGEQGRVIGVDMTQEQLDVANTHKDEFSKRIGHSQCNMDFRHGTIEHLDRAGIEDNSVDLIISNCVVNLSPDKPRVLREAYRVLRPGGELYFSDVYSDRRVPEAARKDKLLWGECVSGALYVEDFKRIAAAAGFVDVRMVSQSAIDVPDSFRSLLGPARFFSITYRLFKLPGMLETLCEDYGQVLRYKGTIPGSETRFTLDKDHVFEVGKPYTVCGNTAAMCGEGGVSWLSKHFEVMGNRDVHFGLFAACSTPAASDAPKEGSVIGGGCC